jgi:hypothetical protein
MYSKILTIFVLARVAAPARNQFQNYTYSNFRALLPGFCNSPVDLKENFKGLARTIGEHLQQRKELRLDILVRIAPFCSSSPLWLIFNNSSILHYASSCFKKEKKPFVLRVGPVNAK